tara:strand:+ start:554 stop:772 length:219 start_codon:yes stop_codon:yes gene_type:complete
MLNINKMKKPCRYVDTIIKSKLSPVDKGLVLEESKTRPYRFIKLLINKMENGKDHMTAMIECSREYEYNKEK